MTTTDNSRADALTRCPLLVDADCLYGPYGMNGETVCKFCGFAKDAKRPVEQHKAAPADDEPLSIALAMVDPCPFCGSENVDPKGWLANDGRSGPACDECGATAESIEGWNRRAQPAPSAPLEGTGNGADEQFERFVSLHELWADAAALCHRVQQGSLSPDDLAAHIRTKIDAGLANARAPRTEVAGAVPIAWVRADDPREAISDEKKRDMIAHAGAPGKKLAECYSIPAYGQPPSADAAAAPIKGESQ
ncbi:Lar family restriction alleviation protein [Burkholderia sp. AU31624]|uniref:Lar family restriction alleviation protein n=1 Tax=Burkholderia sp. AU31624 TaxID=2879629 RepID=UPI001CF37050|nr:Lar family restriction alleviation protein [Burkholderia sp. AU31624]MCA8251809.1 Lar family restriction alleviation protein [Burkholderia sp. AU31624]